MHNILATLYHCVYTLTEQASRVKDAFTSVKAPTRAPKRFKLTTSIPLNAWFENPLNVTEYETIVYSAMI